ncbi:MAG: hypothetical protein ABSG03_20310 [Bryobacteraceae bacterium]|jgi:hypothetical protein
MGRLFRPPSPKPVQSALPLLIRLFFTRFFDKESLSPQGEPAANVTQVLGILATPGAFFLLLALPLRMRGWDLVSLRCLFLCFSMIVMGFILVFEWDALYLDRRDYQILSPLPLPLWKLFLAKAVALGLFLGLFLADINLLTTLFWPSVEKGSAPGIAAAHLLTVAAAGLFAALSAASLRGLLLTLPSAVLRPASVAAQTLLMALLVMALFLSPLIAVSLPPLVRHRSPWFYYFPGYWFTGLYERLRPAVRSPALSGVGVTATRALSFAAALLVLTHLPGYRRHARKMVEMPPPNPSGPGRLRAAVNRLIHRHALKNPAQQAVFHFIGQTISRSMKHRLFLAAYAGFGAAIAALSLGSDRAGLLRLPLLLSFVLVSGLRAAFNFPAELGANWAFQIAGANDARDCLAAVRKWIVLCGIGPLFLLLAPLEFAFFPWPVALFHLAFGVTLSVLLVEIMFFGFQKIPFTCSYFPGKTNLVFLGVIYVFGFSLYSGVMAALESRLIQVPLAAAAFFLAAGAALVLSRWQDRRTGAETALEYQDDGNPAVRTLGLTPQ